MDYVKSIVPGKYHPYLRVFSHALPDTLPSHRSSDHAIELVPGAKPTYSCVYPLSQSELQHLGDWLPEKLQIGFIRPSKSPFGAGVLFASLRLCVDYRALNLVTVRDR